MLALTTSYHTEKNLQKEKSLYKFIWVRQGSITLEIDHQEVTLAENEVISLSNLQHLEFLSIDGEYLTVLFNSNFYCIYGNDHEVSCSGFLFNGSSHVVRFMLNESERRSMEDVVGLLDREFTVSDNLQEEMLRILLKRFIIQSTRIARQRLNITQEKEYSFEIIRQYYNLVDEHFRTKSKCRIMPTCCINHPKHSRTSFLPVNCLRPCASSMNGWKQKPNDSFYTVTKVRKRLLIFWDLRTSPLSAVSSKT